MATFTDTPSDPPPAYEAIALGGTTPDDGLKNTVKLRTPTAASLKPRPTSEFGWQLNLQSLSSPTSTLSKHRGDHSKEDLIALHEEPQWQEADSKDRHLGSSSATTKQLEGSRSPVDDPEEEDSNDHGSRMNLKADLPSLLKRYAGKDIGWQLALQAHGKDPSSNSTPPKDCKFASVDGVLSEGGSSVGNVKGKEKLSESKQQEDPDPPHAVFDLDSAARAFPSFMVDGEAPMAPRVEHNAQASSSGPINMKKVSNNPFLKVKELFGQEITSDIFVPIDSDSSRSSTESIISLPTSRKPPSSVQPTKPVFHCQDCRSQFEPSQIAQIPECDHIICLKCLSEYIDDEPVETRLLRPCPVCYDLDPPGPPPVQGNRDPEDGVVDAYPLEPRTMEVFEELQLAEHSKRIWCPKCKETMLIDNDQYHADAVLICPLPNCRHRWCKQCWQHVPDTGAAVANHRCVLSKNCKECPTCGTMGLRLVSTNNHITCKGLGCRTHFCYKCGKIIANGSSTNDVDVAILSHYRDCKPSKKSKKPCIIM